MFSLTFNFVTIVSGHILVFWSLPSVGTLQICLLFFFFKERERNINVWLPLVYPTTGDLARNPGMCPNWESIQQPFGSQAGAQSTELH